MALTFERVWLAVLPNEEERKKRKTSMKTQSRGEYFYICKVKCFSNFLVYHLMTECSIVVNNDLKSLRKNKVMASQLFNEVRKCVISTDSHYKWSKFWLLKLTAWMVSLPHWLLHLLISFKKFCLLSSGRHVTFPRSPQSSLVEPHLLRVEYLCSFVCVTS